MLQARSGEGEGAVKNETTVERTSDRELVITRMAMGQRISSSTHGPSLSS
jgi:hypothetical protein